MDKHLYEIFLSSSGICTDTRAIKKGSLFICLKGANFNGNEFAEEALKKGADHVIVDEKKSFVNPDAMTLVSDSTKFLQELAKYHREQFSIPVIGITGSNGKTTTKELIHAVLSKKYNVLCTEGNLNNHLGVPFTLLNMKTGHEIAIIEMGANKFKDIEELCDIAQPTHGIITNIGKAHLEGFKNFDGVLQTKKELYDAVENNGGSLIYNCDDEVLRSILPETTINTSYGTSENSNVRGKLNALTPFIQMHWSTPSYASDNFSCKMVGKYNFYNYLAAVAFGVIFQVKNENITKALEEYTPTNNRSQVQKTANNTLIMDCYNANPTSMKSAIESFAEIANDDKLMILGAMKELGDESDIEHQKLLNLCQQHNLKAITVGDEFKTDEDHFSDTGSLTEHLKQHPVKDKLILLKGSRSIGLEVLEKVL